MVLFGCEGELGCCRSIWRLCIATVAFLDWSLGIREVVGGALVGLPFLDEHFHSCSPHSTSHPLQASSGMERSGSAVEWNDSLRVSCVVSRRCWYCSVLRAAEINEFRSHMCF